VEDEAKGGMIGVTLKTLPLSTNHLYAQRGAQRFLTSKARTNKEAMGWEARAQLKGKPLEGPLALDVCLYWPDRRKHDVDNIKSLLDALTGILWLDDGQIEDLRVRKYYDKKAPRVELELFEL
jgi:crossover junction endodeoxyribonuclease RusA